MGRRWNSLLAITEFLILHAALCLTQSGNALVLTLLLAATAKFCFAFGFQSCGLLCHRKDPCLKVVAVKTSELTSNRMAVSNIQTMRC